MKMSDLHVTIKLFRSGAEAPRFTGELHVSAAGASNDSDADEMNVADLKLLWDVETAINNLVDGRCHIELTEEG